MSQSDIKFVMSNDVSRLGINGIYLVVTGLKNAGTNNQFEQYKDEIIHQILDELTPEIIQTDPILKGYRDLHTAVGFSNRNFPAAPETLLENLLKNRRMAHVNLIVDIYNLVSLQTRLALGAHDLAYVTGNIHLKPMTGNEYFFPLGSKDPRPARPGGYSYIDDANEVLCMLDSRQVEKTRVTLETRDCFYIIQGNSNVPFEKLEKGAEILVNLTQKYCGGESKVLYP